MKTGLKLMRSGASPVAALIARIEARIAAERSNEPLARGRGQETVRARGRSGALRASHAAGRSRTVESKR